MTWWRLEDLPDDLMELAATLDPNPTYVVGARWDVLASNPAAHRLFANWPALPRRQRNLLWYYCVDPSARELFVDWEQEAADQLALFREAYKRRAGDPSYARLLERIFEANPAAQDWFDRHQASTKRSGDKRIRLETGQVLGLRQLVLHHADDPDIKVITYFADVDFDDDLWEELDS
ncbi:MAG TPA: hypothetical protein VHM65_00490 [Candidatus Lustribacter sp.]|nr:hypothetical protein [Candidatus Lustribacter sp.]